MAIRQAFDAIDGVLLRALARNPRATTIALADEIGKSRNTVQAHLNKWDVASALRPFERRIDPNFLGYPLRAYVFTRVKQRRLDSVAAALADVREVIAVDGLSGGDDLLVQVVARDGEDLYRIAGHILDIKGVRRTRTAVVMRELIDFRTTQLLP